MQLFADSEQKVFNTGQLESEQYLQYILNPGWAMDLAKAESVLSRKDY